MASWAWNTAFVLPDRCRLFRANMPCGSGGKPTSNAPCITENVHSLIFFVCELTGLLSFLDCTRLANIVFSLTRNPLFPPSRFPRATCSEPIKFWPCVLMQLCTFPIPLLEKQSCPSVVVLSRKWGHVNRHQVLHRAPSKVSSRQKHQKACQFQGMKKTSPFGHSDQEKAETRVPPAIMKPWKEVSVRLNRPSPTFTY